MPRYTREYFREHLTDILGEPYSVEDQVGYYSMKWRIETEKGTRQAEFTMFISGKMSCTLWNFDISLKQVIKLAKLFKEARHALQNV